MEINSHHEANPTPQMDTWIASSRAKSKNVELRDAVAAWQGSQHVMRGAQTSIRLNEELEEYEVELAQMVHKIEDNFHDLPENVTLWHAKTMSKGLQLMQTPFT